MEANGSVIARNGAFCACLLSISAAGVCPVGRQAAAAEAPALRLPEAPYSLGQWPENGRGNHRALVRVEEKAEAVRVRVPWRRWDPAFEEKGIVVIDETANEPVCNAVWYNCNREYGDVVFRPATVPGDYGIYYMPYTQPERTSWKWMGSYAPNVPLAEVGWLTGNGLYNPAPIRSFFSPYVTRVEDAGGTLALKGENGRPAFGSDFQIYGVPRGFAGDDYTMTFALRFENARNTICRATVLFQSPLYLASKGYIASLSNVGGKLSLAITRGDDDIGGRLVGPELARGETFIDWGMDKAGKVTLTAQALADRTVVTLKHAGTRNGQPVEKEIRAEDATAERYTTGKAPVFRLYPGDRAEQPGAWVEDLKIVRNDDGAVVLATGAADQSRQELDLARLPQARLLAMQARNEFNRLHPMGVIATATETRNVLNAHPDERVLFFPEDRANPVMMPDFIPMKWAKEGPQGHFKGHCRPGEYYAFQIGVWAARAPIEDASVEFSDLTGANGTKVPASEVTCYNLGGVDQFGKPFKREFAVGQGKVRALWNGVMIPEDARGALRGAVTVRTSDGSEKAIRLTIHVAGEVIPNHGDNEPWRMSRIRWLNSTLGSDPSVIPWPYKPVRQDGNAIEVIHRRVTYGKHGLPTSIVSFGREILAAPISFEATSPTGKVRWIGGETKQADANPSSVFLETSSSAEDLRMRVLSRNDFDGVLTYEVHLQSPTELQLEDVALTIPVRSEAAQFMTGLGYRGGYRQDNLTWQWDPAYPNNHFWLGRVEAGLGLKILPDRDVWGDFKKCLEEGLYGAWHNEGRGGADLQTKVDVTFLRVFTGPTTLAAGENRRYRFRLYVTPFKPLRPDHWERRLTWGPEGGTVCHFHHSAEVNPYINYPFMESEAMRSLCRELKQRHKDMIIYYTVRELSNRCPELLMFKSLGDEIILTKGAYVFGTEGASVQGSGGGHPWLREHLGTGYSPAWHVTARDGEVDAAVGTDGNSRLANYYVEGLNWLQKEVGDIGLYLDGIGYGRDTMLRIVRMLALNNRDYSMVFHGGDGYSGPYDSTRMSTLVNVLDHVPFITQLMLGECFKFDSSADYWVTDLCGLPFGIDNQYYPVPGPDRVFREMLFGSTSCGGWTYYGNAVRAFWDQWKMTGSRMLGWWDPDCPVKTGHEDILATAYVKQGKTLIALASWAEEKADVRLDIDWGTVGLRPDHTTLVAREIVFEGEAGTPPNVREIVKVLQPEREFAPGDAIPVEPAEGWLLSLEERR